MTTIADPPPLAGGYLRPGDDGYEAGRRVWNAMVDRRPRLIARCADAADVATAVRFARDQDLEIGVRCGGHGVPDVAGNDGAAGRPRRRRVPCANGPTVTCS